MSQARLAAPPASAASTLGLALAALAAGVACGAVAVSGAGLVRLDFAWSAELAIAALAGAALVVLLVKRPDLGACALVALTFSNASDVLVRAGLPSILQLFVPLLLIVLALAPQRAAGADDGRALAWRRAFLVGALAYACIVAASTTWAVDDKLADEQAAEIAKAAFLGVVLAWVVSGAASLRRCAWTLLLTGGALAAMSSSQVLSGHWSWTFGGFSRVKWAQIAGSEIGRRASGPLADPNFYAQALLPLVPVGLALALTCRKRVLRVLAFALSAVVATGIATTYSRGGALVLGLELVALAWVERHRVRRRHFALIGLVAAVAIVAVPSTFFAKRLETLEVLLPGAGEQLEIHDSSVEKRKVLMAAAAEMALDHPLLGVGAGNYSSHFDDYSDVVGTRARIYQDPGQRAFPHSLYLEILAETGLLGLLAFCLAAAAAAWSALRAGHVLAARGDAPSALLVRALAIGVGGVLVSSLILHGDYPRYLWMTFGLAACAAGWAARTAPAETELA